MPVSKKTVTVESEAKEDILVEKDNKEIEALKEENKQLNDKLSRLEELILNLSKKEDKDTEKIDKEPVKVVENTSYLPKMDRPCTLIHLFECIPGLPSCIQINGIPFYFEKFGEKRIFRFADMQNIVSKYRDWFERGILALGADCSEFADDFGVPVMEMPISPSLYNKLETIDNNEFEKLIKNMNYNQRCLIAKTWVDRQERGMSGYENVEKIKILNKYTDNLLGNFLKDLFSSEN